MENIYQKEESYLKCRIVWGEVASIIQENKEEFRAILRRGVIQTSEEQSDIEIRAVDELLDMEPLDYEKMVREYDVFTHTHASLLEDKEKGFKLEAQRHFGPILIGMARKLS